MICQTSDSLKMLRTCRPRHAVLGMCASCLLGQVLASAHGCLGALRLLVCLTGLTACQQPACAHVVCLASGSKWQSCLCWACVMALDMPGGCPTAHCMYCFLGGVLQQIVERLLCC